MKKQTQDNQSGERNFLLLNPVLRSQAGMSLIFIIISILVLGVLAAAMYALTSTSFFNQVSAQQAMKAHYLAESGLRVVASEYKAATAANKNITLTNLNGQTFNAGGGGQFTIDIYPYWLYASTGYASGATSISFKMPGNLPRPNGDDTIPITFPTKGLLKVINPVTGGQTLVGVYTAVSTTPSSTPGTPTTVTFTVPTGFPYDIAVNDELFIGFVQNETNASIFSPSSQTVSQGGNLTLNTAGNIATFFPPGNGNFCLVLSDGIRHNYHYDERKINYPAAGETTLTNVQSACPAATACPPYPTMYNIPVISNGSNSLDPTINTQIYVLKALGIRSTGIYEN